jgi:hypothetical protein
MKTQITGKNSKVGSRPARSAAMNRVMVLLAEATAAAPATPAAARPAAARVSTFGLAPADSLGEEWEFEARQEWMSAGFPAGSTFPKSKSRGTNHKPK